MNSTTTHTIKLLSLVLTLLCVLTSPLSARSIDRTIAKINDDIITESDLAEIISDLAGGHKTQASNAFNLATSETVASMFDRALLLQEANRMKIAPPQDEMHRQVEDMVRDIKANFASDKEFYQALASERLSLDQFKDELLEKTKTDYMVYHVVNSRYSISDQELEGFKSSQVAAGEPISSYRLRRLGIPINKQISTEEACRRARETVTRIITEGISFEEGVRRYSQVPGAAADGGDMGYMSADKLSEDVRAAVQKLEVGQASSPVIAGGYANIFYMEGKRGARSALREQKFFDARQELLTSLRHKAILQVYDDRLLKILPDIYRPALVGADNTIKSASPQKRAAAHDNTQPPATPRSAAAQQADPTPQPQSSRRYIPASAPQPAYTPAAAQYQYYQQPPQPTATPVPQRGLGRWFGRRQ